MDSLANRMTGSMTRPSLRLLSFSPWLKLFGSILAFVTISLYSAIHSELGNRISTGESFLFSWVRTYMAWLLCFGLAYLVLILLVHHMWFRRNNDPYPGPMKVLEGCEAVALGAMALSILCNWSAGIPWAHLLLQIALLLQILVTLQFSQASESQVFFNILDREEKSFFPFLFFLFLLAAVPAYLDPSWQRLRDYVQLDSGFEYMLCRLLPPLFSGITAVWFGVGILIILMGFRILSRRLAKETDLAGAISFLPFSIISALYAAICLGLLVKAMDWEINKLGLKGVILPLFIVLAGGVSALSYAAFLRVAPHVSEEGGKSLIEIVVLSFGAALLLPLTWFLTRRGLGRRSWRLLLASILMATLLLAIYVLYGDLFNPWFTVFSYLKGAILKFSAVVAAGVLTLMVREFVPRETNASVSEKTKWAVVVLVFLLSFFPFATLEIYPETKAAILQFNELSRVDGAYGRALGNCLGFDRWLRLGQNPKTTIQPEPWPQPWTVEKTRPSILPKDFNLLVIMVDALRGDAFHSAGYHRNLTPFLDKWAREEAISFRRAYSQGGGSFAAYPFLVGGRSPFVLYGPDIYKNNLYFELALAEGIKKVMVVKKFGPRAIFPPHFPVIELGEGKSRPNRGSVPADEVFGWAVEAIGSLAEGERFLCFLTLMDVHNDLWKKQDGIDFGDSPRDLYDNNLSYVDRAFRLFVLWLKKKGIYKKTVILFTSDHGEQFWEHGASLHGHTLYEEEIRIPLILLAHGMRARIDDVPVIAADMAPTFAELAGYSVKPTYDDNHMGISLVPLLKGRERNRYLHRDVVGRASFKRRYYFYRNWEWKLIYFAELDLLQLFNTVEDPGETRNLLQERPDLAAELERELLRYLARIEGKNYRPLLSSSLANNNRNGN
jgi:hypothetical protein